MTAPAGAIVGLYVDLVARVRVGDVIETGTGRRYFVNVVREQTRGKHAGRQHLRCSVLAEGDPLWNGLSTTEQNPKPVVHRIRWYRRPGGGVQKR